MWGVLEIGGGRDLLHEPFGPEDSRQLRSQYFDRHLALVLQVLGQVDRRHAAFAEVAFDLVAVGEGGREPGGYLRHQAKLPLAGLRGEKTRTGNPWALSEAPSDGPTRPIVPPLCPLKTAFSFCPPVVTGPLK